MPFHAPLARSNWLFPGTTQPNLFSCPVFGVHHTCYRYQQLYEQGGEEALLDVSKRKPILKDRVSQEVEQAVCGIAIEEPAYGQVRARNELRNRGKFVSPGRVRSIWLRNNLATKKKRLKALEAKVAQDGIVLTEAQVTALEAAKEEKQAYGELETEHPGYLGSQDTFYVVTIIGVGRIYQQTFIDTYTRVAFAQLYLQKHAITAADLLNDRVLPFFEEHGIPLLRSLTDRGTESCGKKDQHEYQLYLAIEDIDHTKTKTNSPQTNGICERFHKTMLEEFYQIAFRKKIYKSTEELQTDLDAWLVKYNQYRAHSGQYCYGKTPMETFKDSLPIAKDKMLNTKHDDTELTAVVN